MCKKICVQNLLSTSLVRQAGTLLGLVTELCPPGSLENLTPNSRRESTVIKAMGLFQAHRETCNTANDPSKTENVFKSLEHWIKSSEMKHDLL